MLALIQSYELKKISPDGVACPGGNPYRVVSIM